ncbi:MAG: MCE family protein [Deltaproteobacteria bacterium]|nr:MCE family protein [Deltaproteobacteria bacterium]
MAKRVSTTAVGAFIVSALALIIAAIMVFGSGRFFRPHHEFVCLFGGSLNGLKIGAPVKFRGVQIGSVTAIRLRIPGQPRITETNAKNAALPVFIELDQSEIAGLGGAGDVGSERILKTFIARGLRAQLATESLLTGLLYVDLDFHEETQPRFLLPPGSKYREIPTVPTSFEQIQEKALSALARLDQIDFGALVASLTDAAKAARDLVRSPQLEDAIVQLKHTAMSMQAAMGSISRTTDRLGANVKPVIESLKKTSNQATLTLATAQTTLADLSGTLDPNSPLGYQLGRTLQDLSHASQAVSTLADYLHRNPSALVRGKTTAVISTP